MRSFIACSHALPAGLAQHLCAEHIHHPDLWLCRRPCDCLLQLGQADLPWRAPHDSTALLAWSFAEAGRYLETLKAYARKPADLIQGQTDRAFMTQLTEARAPCSRSQGRALPW